jgi:hypothetical protein
MVPLVFKVSVSTVAKFFAFLILPNWDSNMRPTHQKDWKLIPIERMYWTGTINNVRSYLYLGTDVPSGTKGIRGVFTFLSADLKI